MKNRQIFEHMKYAIVWLDEQSVCYTKYTHPIHYPKDYADFKNYLRKNNFRIVKEFYFSEYL